MQKTYFFLILLLSLELIYSITRCRSSDGYSVRDDCSNGIATATTDDLGNTPDSCCIAKGIEHYSEEGKRYTDVTTLCLQIEKSKALDYVSLLEDWFEGYYLDQITMTCGSELVYDSKDPSFSEESYLFLSYIRTFNICVLFIFLLF